MRTPMSFGARIFWSFLPLIIISLALPVWWLQRTADREYVDETRRDAHAKLHLVAEVLSRDVAFASPADLDHWLRERSEGLGVRLTYVAPSGVVLADTEVAPDKVAEMENHADRPEVLAARQGEQGDSMRFSATLRMRMLYLAQAVSPRGNLPDGVLRLAVPVQDILNREGRLVSGIVLAAVITFLLAVPICLYLSRQLGASLESMSKVAEAIGSGGYEHRLHDVPGKEFLPLARSINDMAESIRNHVRTITSQKEQLEAVLDGMKEGVMVLDHEVRILSVNPSMRTIFPGIERALGRTPLEAIRDPDLQKACARTVGLGGRGGERLVSIQIEPRQGSVYDVSIVPVRTERADVAAVAVFHDISKLTHLERVRRDFVANVSHELRTPLTSIKGYAETLIASESPDPAASRPFLEIILKNANHMTKIVSDLLNLSRLEAGQQAMEMHPMDLSASLLAAFRECQALAGDKGVKLVSRMPDEGPLVVADYDRIVQVFRNLIENAVRYGPHEGEVAVFVREGNGEAVVGVSDRGPGIPREERGRIFERFYRVEKHRNKVSGSSGLGLAIAKHIVERHGGRIWVDSPAEGDTVGATFYFSLPLAQRAQRNENDTTNGHTAA